MTDPHLSPEGFRYLLGGIASGSSQSILLRRQGKGPSLGIPANIFNISSLTQVDPAFRKGRLTKELLEATFIPVDFSFFGQKNCPLEMFIPFMTYMSFRYGKASTEKVRLKLHEIFEEILQSKFDNTSDGNPSGYGWWILYNQRKDAQRDLTSDRKNFIAWFRQNRENSMGSFLAPAHEGIGIMAYDQGVFALTGKREIQHQDIKEGLAAFMLAREFVRPDGRLYRPTMCNLYALHKELGNAEALREIEAAVSDRRILDMDFMLSQGARDHTVEWRGDRRVQEVRLAEFRKKMLGPLGQKTQQEMSGASPAEQLEYIQIYANLAVEEQEAAEKKTAIERITTTFPHLDLTLDVVKEVAKAMEAPASVVRENEEARQACKKLTEERIIQLAHQARETDDAKRRFDVLALADCFKKQSPRIGEIVAQIIPPSVNPHGAGGTSVHVDLRDPLKFLALAQFAKNPSPEAAFNFVQGNALNPAGLDLLRARNSGNLRALEALRKKFEAKELQGTHAHQMLVDEITAQDFERYKKWRDALKQRKQDHQKALASAPSHTQAKAKVHRSGARNASNDDERPQESLPVKETRRSFDLQGIRNESERRLFALGEEEAASLNLGYRATYSDEAEGCRIKVTLFEITRDPQGIETHYECYGWSIHAHGENTKSLSGEKKTYLKSLTIQRHLLLKGG